MRKKLPENLAGIDFCRTFAAAFPMKRRVSTEKEFFDTLT